MISGKLFNDWGVWLSFSSGSKNEQNYGDNLVRIHTLKTWEEVAYFLKNSMLSDLSNFFPDPNTGSYTKYTFNGSSKKIDSINFFKGDIEPSWEYGDNKKGGYFNFQIQKDTPNILNIYHSSLMGALGNSFQMSNRLKGIRFVDTSTKFSQRFRVQIWMDYNSADQKNWNMLTEHTNELAVFVKGHEIDLVKSPLKFFDIEKDPKKQKQDKNKP